MLFTLEMDNSSVSLYKLLADLKVHLAIILYFTGNLSAKALCAGMIFPGLSTLVGRPVARHIPKYGRMRWMNDNFPPALVKNKENIFKFVTGLRKIYLNPRKISLCASKGH